MPPNPDGAAPPHPYVVPQPGDKTLPDPAGLCLARQDSDEDWRKMELGRAYTVLTADGEEAARAQLYRLLAPECEVLTAASVDEALSHFSDGRPDIVLLDADLVGGKFSEVRALLQDRAGGRALPIIIMAGPEAGNAVEHCLLHGAADCLEKPLRNAVVKARVKTHIQIARQMRLIQKLGFIDSLTNIPNRRSFDEHMNKEWRRAVREKKPISFLMIDLDNFKSYNDTHGHLQGDEMLKAAAKIFADAARRPGDLAARIGGEEFGIILPDTDMQGARNIAENIRKAAERGRVIVPGSKQAHAVTVSIGIASGTPAEGAVLREFIAKADAFLYVAKRAGRNRVCPGIL
ncbi:MAG: diguanylate cyclase [Desulfovibrio sp.]|jgi:diguanylate cyclase (GGDEF)-like protein|nr:diguanylate cyclase [Desulfovibrio sp.]